MTRDGDTLVFGLGNPSRGDDALGPLFVGRIEGWAGVAGLVDTQLQVEHTLDLVGPRRVLFVDASVRAPAPFRVEPVRATRPRGMSHALSPAELYGVAAELGAEAPPAWTLALRGESFGLGDPPTARALRHLEAALVWLRGWVDAPARLGWRLVLEGRVQGVGMRPWLARTATGLGLVGDVVNVGGRVVVHAAGAPAALEALLRAVQDEAPAGSEVDGVTLEAWDGDADGVRILAGDDHDGVDPAGPGLGLVPDFGICDVCLAEARGGDDADGLAADRAEPRVSADRADDHPAPRYAGYPHTSCAACGPRLAITHRAPWDRANTTLAAFPRCPACQRAYDNPADRRFHAEGSSCARCGPGVWLAHPDGGVRATPDPVATAADLLRAGALVAVAGVGAIHLACDATNPVALRRLRTVKHRETRPFAVLVADVAAAHALVHLDDAAEAVLSSPARPIVVAPGRGVLPPEVGASTVRVGVMLPPTALHDRLVGLVGRPLVLTSANRSGLPALTDAADAVATLADTVDAHLLHDRGIVHRVEDSVVLAARSGPRPVRLARGYAPTTFRLDRPVPAPLLALGGHMKITVALAVGDTAWVGPHLGDLDTAEAEAACAAEVDAFERLVGVHAELLVHDAHPGYASSRYAEARGGPRVAVQHHVAHAAAVLAEHRVDEPVVAVIVDGTGWGPDGTAWGAEVLVVDGADWTRVGTVRPLPLPGGEAAIRHPVRAALGMLADAFGDDVYAHLDHAVFRALAPDDRDVLLRMLATETRVVRARGLGRWFDAVGALGLGLAHAGHDGQVAVALEEAAGTTRARPYPVETTALPGTAGATPHEADLRPAVRALVAELEAGAAPGLVAARFHETWVELLAAQAARALAEAGLRRVVLGGGALLNERLHDGLVTRLGADRVLTPRRLPCNDGGLALGQVWVGARGG